MENDWRIWAALIGSVTGACGWILRHATNHNKHICKDDLNKLKNNVQWKDVCEQRYGRLEDAIENLAHYSQELHNALVKNMDELKELIKNSR